MKHSFRHNFDIQDNKHFKLVGLDLSINSTGLSIIEVNNTDISIKHHIIAPVDFESDLATVNNYSSLISNVDYIGSANGKKEFNKIQKFDAITQTICNILIQENIYLIKYIVVEGISYGARFSSRSTSSNIYDLSALNGIVRSKLMSTIPNAIIDVTTPTSNKKQFTGSGKAKKENVLYQYKQIMNIDNDETHKHYFDIADSFALAYNQLKMLYNIKN